MTTKLYPSLRNTFFSNPFDLLSNFDDLFYPLPNNPKPPSRHLRAETVPRANVLKTHTGYQIELAAPGLSRDDFEMSIDNKVLSITVNTEDGHDYEDSVHLREWSHGSFTRSWTLPESTNIERVSARYDVGILHVDVPTADVKEARRVITIE